MAKDEDIIAEIEPAKWKPLELFRTVYPEDDDYDNLDILYPGRIGYIYKREDGSIEKIVIAKVWPRDEIQDEEEALYLGGADQ